MSLVISVLLMLLAIAIAPLHAAPPEPSTSELDEHGWASLDLQVIAAPGVSESLVERSIDEARRIWEAARVRIRWCACRETDDPLVVVIGEATGRASSGLPLGWTIFTADGRPTKRVELSRANAELLLKQSPAFLPSSALLTQSTTELYLSRALGRALAHEIGHVVLATANHVRRGLMQANRTPQELFGAPVHLELDAAAQKRAWSALIRQDRTLARR